jgi:outer membrane biosynthesis protein TonB
MTDPDLRDPNLDRAYRETPRDEPPPELDERIRAAARRAVGTRPQSLAQHAADERRRSWTSRWRVPLSVAATLVIAATLTVMVQEEERRPRDDSGRNVVPKTESRDAEPSAAPASEPDVAASRAMRSAPAPTAAPTPPRPAAAPVESAPQPKHEERARSVEQPAATDTAPAPLEKRQTAVPAAAPPAAAPTPAPTAPLAAPKPALQSAPAGAASDTLRRDRTLGDRPERASREASANAVRSPEAWVEHIRTLRAQGRDAEATIELAELRRTYPDFRLPPDLAR